MRNDFVWSDEMFRIFGYDKVTSATHEMALRRVHPDDLARVQGVIERLSRDGNDCADDHRLLMPDGSSKQHVHLVVRATNDGPDGVDFIGAVTDITAVKEARSGAPGELFSCLRLRRNGFRLVLGN